MTVRARLALEDVTNTGRPGKGSEADAAWSPRATPRCRAYCDGRRTGVRRCEAWELPELVSSCAAELRELWARSAAEGAAANPGDVAACSSRMHAALLKFSRLGPPRFAAALQHPPTSAPPPLPLAEVLPQCCALQQASAGEASKERCEAAKALGCLPPAATVADALECRRHAECAHPDARADEVLRELASSVMQASHEESERHMPSAERVLARLGSEERETILLWLVQVCSLRNIPDTVLYSAALLFDRYCAASEEPLPIGRLHLTVLAILSIAMKVTGGGDDVRKPYKLRELLGGLGQQMFSVEEIFKAEVEVLQALDFEVSAPSPLDFLDALALPFTQPSRPEASSPVVCLAKFLLQLSILDAPLQYRYPHAVLAAGAVYVALWCTQASPSRAVALLCDVAAATGSAACEPCSPSQEDAPLPTPGNAPSCRADEAAHLADDGLGSGGRRSPQDAKGAQRARALRRL